MSLFNIFDIAGSGMSAQSVRLNTIASNIANADSISGDPDKVYKARYPVFSTLLDQQSGQVRGVKVNEIVQGHAPSLEEYNPNHPMADENGYIYRANISTVDEMANMISASRSYQSSVQAMNTTKQLILSTLNIGR